MIEVHAREGMMRQEDGDNEAIVWVSVEERKAVDRDSLLIPAS